MKLSKKTIEVLKCFATINSNLLIVPGNRLKTMAVAKNIFAEAEVDETFPAEFGVYNAQELLGALSLFKEADLTFNEKAVTIVDAQQQNLSLRYVGASKDILVYPEKDVRQPAYDVSFDLSADNLNSILKAAAVIGAPDLQVVGTQTGISIRLCDKKNPSSNDFQLQISTDPSVEDFTYSLKIANLKLFAGDQRVSISGKGLSKWENVDAKVRIYIALEAA